MISPCATAIAKARDAKPSCNWLRSPAEGSSLLDGTAVLLEGWGLLRETGKVQPR